MNKKYLTGLIGYPLTHSFSKNYFSNKFDKEGLGHFSYLNFEIENIQMLKDVIDSHPDLIGLNVTIPYKQSVIPFLDDLSEDAAEIGAVNTICMEYIANKPYLTGYNTDHLGFGISLDQILKSPPSGALVLGTGGASLAVIFDLNKRGIKHLSVSRSPEANQLSYNDIDRHILENYSLIINTSPVGMYPDIDVRPDIPYHLLGPENTLIDLIYNPEQTLFLKSGKQAGASTLNGLPMLIAQAEASWKLWNKSLQAGI